MALSCALYALLYALAVPLEVAYKWDQFGHTAKIVASLVFLWILITTVSGLFINQKLTSERRSINGLIGSISVCITAAMVLFAALSFFLPTFPITEATFQTYPAQAAYLKDISYFLPLAVIFLLVPYHFVVAVEREVNGGRHREVLAVLINDEYGISPRGTFYPRVWALALLLACALPLSLYMSAKLLDNLTPSPYTNLFTQLVYVRALLFFGLGLECLIWYQRVLNEIKRECLVLQNSISTI